MIRTSNFSSRKNSGGIVILYAFVLILIITVLIGFMGKRVVLTLAVTSDAFHEKQAFWNAYAGLNIASLVNLAEKRKILLDTGDFEITGPMLTVKGGDPLIEIKNGEAATQTSDWTDFGEAGSYERIFTIQNPGTDELILTDEIPISVTSVPADLFVVKEQARNSDGEEIRIIEAKESATFKLHFIQELSAANTAVVSIKSNTGTYQFTIKATGPSGISSATAGAIIAEVDILPFPATYSSWGRSVGDDETPNRAFKTLRKVDPTSAILLVGASSNAAPTATAQTVEVNVVDQKIITLAGDDPNDDPMTFIITGLPTNGLLYQAPSGKIGDMIYQTPTTVIGNQILQDLYRVIYVAPETNGAGHGNFKFKASDFIQESSAVTATVNVNPVPIMKFGSNRSEITDPAVDANHLIDIVISNSERFDRPAAVHYKIRGEYTYYTDFTINDESSEPVDKFLDSPLTFLGPFDVKKSQTVKVKARPGYQGTRYIEFVLQKNPISPDLYSIGADSIHTMVINDPLVSGAYALEEMPGFLGGISASLVSSDIQGHDQYDCNTAVGVDNAFLTLMEQGYPDGWDDKISYNSWLESETYPESPEDGYTPGPTPEPSETLVEFFPYSFVNTAEDLYTDLASESPLANMEIMEANTTNLFFHWSRIDDKLTLVFNHDDPRDHDDEATPGRAVFVYRGARGTDPTKIKELNTEGDMAWEHYSLRDDDEGSSDGANERGTYTPRFGQNQPQLEVKWKWAADETDGGLIDLGSIWNSSCVEIQPGVPGSGTGYDKVKKWKVRSASMWNTKPLTDTRDYSSSSIETEKTFTMTTEVENLVFNSGSSEQDRAAEKLIISYVPELELISPVDSIHAKRLPRFRWKKFGRNARYTLLISTNEDFPSYEVEEEFGIFEIEDTYIARDHPTSEDYDIIEVSWESNETELEGFINNDKPTWLKYASYDLTSEDLTLVDQLSALTTYYWKVKAEFVDPVSGLNKEIYVISKPGVFTTF